MILVDTSAWIELLRGSGHPAHITLRYHLERRSPIATTEPIIMELLAGTRSRGEGSKLRSRLIGLPRLTLRGLVDFESAAELYRDSERKYEGTPQDLEYEAMQSRKVAKWGSISWESGRIFISAALAGWSVGLEPCGEGKRNVWFGRLLIGQLEEKTLSFQRAESCGGAPEQKNSEPG